MNRIALLIFALTSTVCVAQNVAQPAPQCPKYQHVQPGHPAYFSTNCDTDATSCAAITVWHEATPDKCVDDMHQVTEEQWQALKTSIDLLKKMVTLEEEQIKLISSAKVKP